MSAAPPVRVAHLTTTDLTLRYLLLGQLTRLREEGYEVTAISAPGPNTAAIEAAGVRHLAWRNATRSWNPRAPSPASVAPVLPFRRQNQVRHREALELSPRTTSRSSR